MSAMLEVTDLHAYYGKSHILQGVNFNVQEGEIVEVESEREVRQATPDFAALRQIVTVITTGARVRQRDLATVSELLRSSRPVCVLALDEADRRDDGNQRSACSSATAAKGSSGSEDRQNRVENALSGVALRNGDEEVHADGVREQ